MADNTGIRAILDVARAQPVAAWTLASVIVGGSLVYAQVTSDARKMRQDLDALAKTTTETHQKFEGVRDKLTNIQGDLREAVTNLRWLMKQKDRAELRPGEDG